MIKILVFTEYERKPLDFFMKGSKIAGFREFLS